jgi:hypothetical protein
MLYINLERKRKLRGKKYSYEGLNLTEAENLREFNEMEADDRFWNYQDNQYRDERRYG